MPNYLNCTAFKFALIFSSLALITACEKEAVKITPKLVVVEKVSTATVPLYGNYVGVTKASLDVEVRARVDGFVENKSFIEGSAVKAGGATISYR